MLIEYYNLPRIINLADLNWTEFDTTENPIHQRLIAKVDLATMQIIFFIRSRYKEEYFSEEQENFYQSMYIVDPIN